jgi:UDP-3-O-[3-hydroxymyristoyl] glucosamine N-acyltransferase
VIGTGCIIGEKSVIGGPATGTVTGTSTPVTPTSPSPLGAAGTTTTIEDNVIISPLSTVSSGSCIHEAATIDTSAFVGSHASVGAHSKVCSRCRIPDYGRVDEWIVVFGGVGDGGGGLGSSNNGFGVPGQRRRRRKRVDGERKGGDEEVEVGAQVSGSSAVEDGRLAVLGKEREVLGRLIGPAAGGMRRK